MPNNSGDIYSVSGSVWSPERSSVGRLTVRLVDKNIGSDVELAETMTDDSGMYRMTAQITPVKLKQKVKTQPDLQVRVFSGDTFLAASEVRYNASNSETLDVALPAGLTALPSEYETLRASLDAVYGGKLVDLQETTEQRDITYLANKTAWDARAVALAAFAEQFSQIPAPQTPPICARAGTQPTAIVRRARKPLPATRSPPATAHGAPPSMAADAVTLKPEFYYALFRAGVPANADALFQTTPKTARSVWEQAIKQGVIPQPLAHELDAAVQRFEALSAAHTLDANPPIGVSTLREMLQTSLSDPTQQEQFAQTYVHHRDDPAALWSSLEHSLGKATTKRLQLNGQLYYLTLNNAPLVRALHAAEQQEPLASTLDLAMRGYHDPAKWMPLIGDAIPSHIPGDGVDEKRSNYARLLGAKIRLAFPTAVVADLVRRGTFRLSNQSVKPAHVADFLAEHQGKFAIGMEPVEAYIARTKLKGWRPSG
jgi:hypothetical protein